MAGWGHYSTNNGLSAFVSAGSADAATAVVIEEVAAVGGDEAEVLKSIVILAGWRLDCRHLGTEHCGYHCTNLLLHRCHIQCWTQVSCHWCWWHHFSLLPVAK